MSSPYHGDFFVETGSLDSIGQDQALTVRAIENIQSHPVKYAQNWVANVGRLLFSYPYSYTEQKLSTFFYLIPNGLLVALAVFLLYPTYLLGRSIPFEIYALLGFFLIAFGGSSLVSAYERQFHILPPLLVPWLALVLSRLFPLLDQLRPHKER